MMVKYLNTQVTFREIPNEISLCINITNCPCHCVGCHSSYLWKDIGNDLTPDVLQKLIDKNDGITCVCFMGHGVKENFSYMNKLSEIVHRNGLISAIYSGFDNIHEDERLSDFDYIKEGHYDEKYGGLDKKTTNQKIFHKKVEIYLYNQK